MSEFGLDFFFYRKHCTFFFFWRSSRLLVEGIICAGWSTLTPNKGKGRITQCDSVYLVYGKTPTRQLSSIPMAVSGSGHTRKQNQCVGCCRPYARNSATNAILGRMQPTLYADRPTPHGASRLVQAMPAWSVKTRRAPPRHCRYARVHSHSTTAVHDMSTPTPR